MRALCRTYEHKKNYLRASLSNRVMNAIRCTLTCIMATGIPALTYSLGFLEAVVQGPVTSVNPYTAQKSIY